MSLINCLSVTVDSTLQCSTKCSFTTLSAALASGASIIYVKAGTYNEPITVSNVTIQSDVGVVINNLTVNNVTLIGGTYNNLITLGTVVIRDAIVSLINNGVLEITNSKILSLTNNNCASIYNNYIFAPIVSTGGTVNMAENIICPSSTSLTSGSVLNATNTNARVLSNTILNNSPNFIAYTADDNSVIRSSNNTFRVSATTPYVGSSTNGSSLITNDDAWTSAVLPARYVPIGVPSEYDANLNFNGNDVINALYTNVTTVTTAYATTPDDHTIIVTAPGGNVTLTTPPEDGQIIFVRNDTLVPITVNGVTLDPGNGVIYTYGDGAWQLIANTGVTIVPPPLPFSVNDTVFVDAVYGNNLTAAPEDPARPAATIEYAVSIAPTPTSLIYVRPGTYTPATGFTTNNFEFLPSTIVNWTVAGTLFGGTSNVYSEGIFNLSSTGTLFGSTGTLDANVINQVSTGAVYNSTGGVIKINRLVISAVSTITDGTVDIKQATLSTGNVNFFALVDSTLSIQLLQDAYAGAPGNYVFTSTGNSSLIVDNYLSTGTPRRLITNAGNLNIQLGNISNVSTLVAGAGITTGQVGNIISNTVEALFNDGLGTISININSVISVGTNTLLLDNNSYLQVDNWDVTSSNNWSLDTSTISIGNLNLTNCDLFTIPGTSIATININTLVSVGTRLITVSNVVTPGSVLLNIQTATIDGPITPYMSVAGSTTMVLGDINYTGGTLIETIPGGNVTVSIERYTGTQLGDLGSTYSNWTIALIDNAAGVYTGYLFTGTAGNHTLTINSMNLVDTRLINSTATVQLSFSGNVTGDILGPFIALSGADANKIDVNNFTATSFTQSLVSYGAGTVQQLLDLNNVNYGTGYIVSLSAAVQLVNINNLVTAGPIIDAGAGNEVNLNIDNLSSTSYISSINYSPTTLYKLHLSNAIFNSTLPAINIGGSPHVAGNTSSISIEVESSLHNGTGGLLLSNTDALILLRAETARSVANTLVTINSNGTFTRLSGKYSVINNASPAVQVNPPSPPAAGTIQGIYLFQCELVSVPSMQITVTLIGFATTYAVRTFATILTTAVSLSTSGPGTFVLSYPIQVPTVYSPLPN